MDTRKDMTPPETTKVARKQATLTPLVPEEDTSPANARAVAVLHALILRNEPASEWSPFERALVCDLLGDVGVKCHLPVVESDKAA